jgi:hypothetical protein
MAVQTPATLQELLNQLASCTHHQC